MTLSWRVVPLGEGALLVEAERPDPGLQQWILRLVEALDAAGMPGIEPPVPGIASVLVPFDPLAVSFEAVERHVRQLLRHGGAPAALSDRVVSIPVTYGGEHGPDLAELASRLGLTPGQFVDIHSAATYRVLLIGFAPGFPYLGPLPPQLVVPRRSTPRTGVPAGSVAIAAQYTGIYPSRLPGGWHLVGHTSTRLFDASSWPPALLRPGDSVRFVPQAHGIVP